MTNQALLRWFCKIEPLDFDAFGVGIPCPKCGARERVLVRVRRTEVQEPVIQPTVISVHKRRCPRMPKKKKNLRDLILVLPALGISTNGGWKRLKGLRHEILAGRLKVNRCAQAGFLEGW